MVEMDEDEDESGPAKGGRMGKGKSKGKGRGQRADIKVVSAKAQRSGEQIRKKDFIGQVAAAAGGKRAEVRGVVDAVLALIADRLAAGDELVLPPLGRLRLMRERDNGKARIATLRLQMAGEGEVAGDPLAEAGD